MYKFNKKKLTKKVIKIIKSDVFASLALVSILFNVFFFTGVIMFTSTNSIDLSLHRAATTNLCEKNYEANLQKEMNKSTDPALAKTLFEITCQDGDFYRYYDNAVQAYLSDAQ